MTKWDLFQMSEAVQHSKINQCNPLYQSVKNKIHMILSIDTEKHLTKFNTHS